jgi:hypothetical protein
VTFRKFPKNILALALLLISSFAFSDSEYFYNELEDGVEIAGCKGDCSLLPEKVDGKNIKGISDSAFNINVFTGLGWSLTWNYRFNSETDSSYIDESAWFNDTENSSDLPILILGQSPDGQGSDFEDRAVPPVNSSNLHNLSSIKIPQGYQYIGDYFFSSNSLENISLNEGLQTIGMQAFSSNGIRDIVIPDSVIEISSKAFAINPLSHVIFLGNRPRISLGVFDNNLDLVNILYCSEATGWPGESIEGITPQPDESCDSTNEMTEANALAVFDIDQNGSFDALTDGLILLRYAFGLRGDNLINGVIASDAYRTSASEIEAHIQSYLP